MGRSVTCTYQVNINYTNGNTMSHLQSCMGAMNLKGVLGCLLSEQNFRKEQRRGVDVLNAEFWPQTAKGRKYMDGHDFAIMDLSGNVTRMNIKMELNLFKPYVSIGDLVLEVSKEEFWKYVTLYNDSGYSMSLPNNIKAGTVYSTVTIKEK